MPRCHTKLSDQSILTGCPVDKVKQLVLGLESVNPPPGSITVPCDRCHDPLYLSPHQQESRRHKPGRQCLCMLCLMTHMRESGIVPPLTTFDHDAPTPLAACAPPAF
jgi:hypothetical protein